MMQRVSAIPTPLRELVNADTCPVGLLPWLARYVGVSGWSSDWPESVKRERVRQAINIARHKGTSGSVRDAVASFGGEVALREWWEKSPPDEPYTFEMVLTVTGSGSPTTAAFVDDIVAEVDRVKPARSRFTFIQGLAGAAGIAARGAGRVAVFARLDMTAVVGG